MSEITIDKITYIFCLDEDEISSCNKCDYYDDCVGQCKCRIIGVNWRRYYLKKK